VEYYKVNFIKSIVLVTGARRVAWCFNDVSTPRGLHIDVLSSMFTPATVEYYKVNFIKSIVLVTSARRVAWCLFMSHSGQVTNTVYSLMLTSANPIRDLYVIK